MEKSKKFYWAVFNAKKEILFEGSFSSCWKWFVKSYGASKLHDLDKSGIRISRQS